MYVRALNSNSLLQRQIDAFKPSKADGLGLGLGFRHSVRPKVEGEEDEWMLQPALSSSSPKASNPGELSGHQWGDVTL